MTGKFPDTVINRLTLYHCILVDYIKNNFENITSSAIAGLLKIDDSQVRKDISLLKNTGKSRVGYNVLELKNSIEKTLGFERPKNAFIVGAGNLGMALANYNNFADYGLNVVALFDNDTKKIGNKIKEKQIYDIEKLPELARKLNIEMAILTVPMNSAQDIADFLVKSNIKYIWNFSPSVLVVPKDVEVWNENLMGNFLQFSYKIGK